MDVYLALEVIQTVLYPWEADKYFSYVCYEFEKEFYIQGNLIGKCVDTEIVRLHRKSNC